MGNNGAGVTKRRRERDADCDNLLRTIMTPEAEDLNPQRFDIDSHMHTYLDMGSHRRVV